MSGDGGLRVGPWVPDPSDRRDSRGRHAARELAATPHPEPSTPARTWWEDAPDPWDQPLHHQQSEPEGADPSTRPGPAGQSDSPPRRTLREAGLRRVAVIVVLVGVVLMGSGALANMLRPEPSALPLPPTSPPEQPIPTPPERQVGLDTAPSPTPSATAAGPPVITAPTPAPAPEPTPSPSPSAEPTAAPSSAAIELSFEAEEAELGGSARRYRVDGASGGRAVGDLGAWGFSYVRFPTVTVPRDGEYEVTFHYLSTRERTGHYSVNGRRLRAAEFPRLPEGEVGTVTVTVRLRAGENTVWFGSTRRTAPDLDRITVTG